MEESAYAVTRAVEENRTLVVDRTPEERMLVIIELRLKQLEPMLSTWPQAIALGLLPANAPTTVRNLALLSDVIFLYFCLF